MVHMSAHYINHVGGVVFDTVCSSVGSLASTINPLAIHVLSGFTGNNGVPHIFQPFNESSNSSKDHFLDR